MRLKTITSLFFCTFGISMAHADIIYSNLNPLTPFDTSNGSFIASGGIDDSLSFAFGVTGHNYSVNSITFGAFLSSGVNAITATIYADNGGTPGQVLFTASEIDNQMVMQGATNSDDADLIIQTVNGPLLLAGNTYWLGLDAPGDSQVTWGNNGNPSITGPGALLLSGNWSSTAKVQGAFEIDGAIAAPEPFSAGLLASGLGLIVLSRFRRKFSGGR